MKHCFVLVLQHEIRSTNVCPQCDSIHKNFRFKGERERTFNYCSAKSFSELFIFNIKNWLILGAWIIKPVGFARQMWRCSHLIKCLSQAWFTCLLTRHIKAEEGVLFGAYVNIWCYHMVQIWWKQYERKAKVNQSSFLLCHIISHEKSIIS